MRCLSQTPQHHDKSALPTIFFTVLAKMQLLHPSCTSWSIAPDTSVTETETERGGREGGEGEGERKRDAWAPRLSAPILVMAVKTLASTPCLLCQNSSCTFGLWLRCGRVTALIAYMAL